MLAEADTDLLPTDLLTVGRFDDLLDPIDLDDLLIGLSNDALLDDRVLPFEDDDSEDPFLDGVTENDFEADDMLNVLADANGDTDVTDGDLNDFADVTDLVEGDSVKPPDFGCDTLGIALVNTVPFLASAEVRLTALDVDVGANVYPPLTTFASKSNPGLSFFRFSARKSRRSPCFILPAPLNPSASDLNIL